MSNWPTGDGEMARLIRAHDWASTPLGPAVLWSERLKLMVEQVLASPLVSSLVCGPERVLIYNDAAAQLYEGRHPAALGQPLPEVFPEGWKTVKALYERVFAGEPVHVTGQPLDTCGEGEAGLDIFDAVLTPIHDEEGRVTWAHMIGFEVGARVRTEAALRESEARFRALATVGSSSVYRMSPDWREMRRLDGVAFLADTEATTSDWVEVYIPLGERPRVREAINQAVSSKGVFELEHRVLRADGTIGWTFSRAISLLDDAGEIVEWFGAATDVTARVKADQSFTRLFQASPAPFLVVRPDASRFTITEVNDAYLAATMRTRETVIGRGIFEAYPDDPDANTAGVGNLRASLERVLASHQPDALPSLKYDIARPDGTFESRWWSPVNSPVLNEDGEVEAIIHNANDVTASRRAEIVLRESEERFAQFASSSSDGLWIRHAGTLAMEYASPAIQTIYGIASDAILGDMQRWVELIVPDDRDAAIAHIEQAQSGASVTHEFRIQRSSDGALRWIRNTDFPLRDAGGRVQRIGGLAKDVTELRAAETAIAMSEKRLQLALDVGQLATWDWDMTTGEVVWNDEHCRMQGYEPGEVKPSLQAWRERVHPDDLELTIAAIDDARDHQQEYKHEFRNLLPDGSVRWMYARGRFFYDDQGRPTRMIGVMEDVTDRQEAEKAVSASEDRLRTLMEGIPQLVWRSADDGLWTWSSLQWQTYTGQTREQSLGWGWLDVVHPDDHHATLLAWHEARPHGRLDTECRIRRASDGTWRWHATRSVPLYAAPASGEMEGRILEWLGTTTDIQDLKHLQEQQSVMVAELQHRTRNLIAVVRGLADDTMDYTGPTEAFRKAFAHRLSALSRVQGLLSRSDAEPITIDALVRLELDAIGVGRLVERVTVAGPDVFLRSSNVQTLALALHELATNARKYGALSHDQGRLTVTWQERIENGEARVAIEWLETGLEQAPDRPVETQRDSGYGRELIEHALPHAMGAQTSYTLTASGVQCALDIPARKKSGVDR